MIEVLDQVLPGVQLLAPRTSRDARGEFVKTFHAGAFAELGLDFAPVEEFFSTSLRGVVRGMHFQLPPYQHAKLVYCIVGRVTDVVLDMRRHSLEFRKFASAELSSANRRMLFIPAGVAHGFLAEEDSVMIYQTSTVHAPSHEGGVRWNSFGFDWGSTKPILSQRDAGLPAFDELTSPF